MRLSHAAARASIRFDDPNLVSCPGLLPVVRLGVRAGLPALVTATLTVAGSAGAFAAEKVLGLLAGMIAGADSIDDMNLLRRGGMSRLFANVRAPSTFGTFLRAFTFGHVRQLDRIAGLLLGRLARTAPLLPGADQIAFLDVDDTIKQTYGYAKQGAGYGYNGVKGLNALLATIATPLAAPVIVACRLRKGSANSARGASRLVCDAIKTARAAGVSGVLIVRADSAYYGYEVIAAARRAKACFSVTARMTSSVKAAISQIPDTAWTAIRYPNAIFDEDEQRWISDAEVAEIDFTAFTSRRKGQQVDGRLIVRRVRRLAPAANDGVQGEMFAAWRYHGCFTDSPMTMLQAESQHRGHAIIEQVHADLRSGALAHLPSGSFCANGAWLVLATIAFNLTRTAGTLAGRLHAKATTGTVRAQLIWVPARIASSARRIILHAPEYWPWQHAFEQLDSHATGPPVAA
jgi:hypothetical protein